MDKIQDVSQLRKEFLDNLSERVESAFKNRKQEVLDIETKSTMESRAHAIRQRNRLRNLPDNATINVGSYVQKPNVVTVDNPHDYRDLSRLVLQKLAAEGYFSGDIDQAVDEILEHEFEHHVPGLDQKKLEIKYGIQFFEDSEIGFVGYRPALYLNGMMQLGIYRDIIGSVRNKSVPDKIGTR